MTGGEQRGRAPGEAAVGERTEHVICMVAAAALVIVLALGIATI